MQEVINFLVKKINNKTISLQDFSDILIDKNIENSIKFMSLLCEDPTIDRYLSSFFIDKKYTEKELVRKYGEINGNTLTIYGILKNLIKEEIIDYKDVDIRSLDSTSLFFKDMLDLPILSKEDTLMYIKIYQEAKMLGKEDICDKYRNLIIEGNIRLIVYIAKTVSSTDASLLDLVNEGFFGMSKAIDSYDSSYGCSFSTYSYYWIKQKMMRSIYNKERNIRIPIHTQDKYRKVMKVKEKLTNTLGREATIKEVAEEMNEDCAALEKLIINLDFLTSLDAEVKDDSETARYNFVPDKINLEEAVVNKTTILKLLECLTEREKDVITKRYGADYTLEDIGKMYGMTRERVRQIEEKALFKMRRFSQSKIGNTLSNERKYVKVDLTGKTLTDLIGKEKIKEFDYYVNISIYVRSIFYKAFGPNLDEVYKDNLTSREATYLKQALKLIASNDYKSLGKEYNGKTLKEIFVLENVDLLWNEITKKNNSMSSVFIKAFGIDGKESCNLDNLSYDEKRKIIKWISKYMNEKPQKNDITSYKKLNEIPSKNDTLSPKKLNEILGLSYEDTVRFVNSLDKNENLYKAFGNTLNEFLDKSKFSEKDYKNLLRRLGLLNKKIREDNIYKGKTLVDLIDGNVSDVKKVATPSNLVVLTKAFGENLDLKFINNVSISILAKTLEYIKNKINNESKEGIKKDKRRIYAGKTLGDILGINYEEVLNIFNKERKNTKVYLIFVKVFGSDFTKTYDTSNLTKSEKNLLLVKLNKLKEKIEQRQSKENENINKETENINKYYKVIIDFMPKDYKMILYLFLGIYSQKYSVKQIAEFLKISETEVSLKVETGMNFIKNVINAYNEAFTKSSELENSNSLCIG